MQVLSEPSGYEAVFRNLRNALQVHVASLQNFHDLGIKPFSGLFFDRLHGAFERYRGTILSVGGQCVEAIDDGAQRGDWWALLESFEAAAVWAAPHEADTAAALLGAGRMGIARSGEPLGTACKGRAQDQIHAALRGGKR